MELHAKIVNSKIEYDDKNYKERIQKFKDKNKDKNIIVTFDVLSQPQNYFHRYYRGYLLRDVAHAMGETDYEYVHRYFLKKKFKFYSIEKINDVPTKYRKKCIIYTDIKDGKEIVVGYSPSTADFSDEEFVEYLQKVEYFLIETLNSHIACSYYSNKNFDYHQENAYKLRTLASTLLKFDGEIVNE